MANSHINLQTLFAERIGGEEYGKLNKVFKFTLIDNAKREFMRQNPQVKVIDMGVGEPEEVAPELVQRALYEASKVKANRIYPNNGVLEFKQAAARYLSRLLDLEFDPAREIVHCIGTKSALAQIPLAFINPGDTVIATSPGYPVMPTIVCWLGGRVVNLPLRASANFLPDLGELETTVAQNKPKLVLLNYPNNPTGSVATPAFYTSVVQLAHKYNFIIVQDAAYADMVHAGRFCSPQQAAGGRDVSIELYSLSKSYNMQGYRLGFVVSNPTLLSAYTLVKDNTDNGQFIATQFAGIEALDNCGEYLGVNCAKYRRRLESCFKIFRAAGLDCLPSPGTFYLYVKTPSEFQGQRFTAAQSFSDYLIAKHGLISVPWDDGEPYLRFSMTFEVGNEAFADEEQVFAELSLRLKSTR